MADDESDAPRNLGSPTASQQTQQPHNGDQLSQSSENIESPVSQLSGSAPTRSSSRFNPDASEFVPSTAIPDKNELAAPSCCVWVGNVCPELPQADFEREFQRFGDVKLVRMFPRSRCAFVTFATPEEALASQELENKMLGSMKLTLNVGRASRHLWVGNIGGDVEEDALRAEFAKFGEVESVRVLRQNKCAFVNFDSEDEALTAARALNGMKIGEHEIVINFQWNESQRHGYTARGQGRAFRQRDSRSSSVRSTKKPVIRSKSVQHNYNNPSKQLFVGNIDQSVNQNVLWSLFSQFGEVQRIKRFSDRGYAFVVFRSLNDAIWAREQMAIYPPIVNNRPLDVNFGRNRNKDMTNRSESVSPPFAVPPASPMLQTSIPVGGVYYFYQVPASPMMGQVPFADDSTQIPPSDGNSTTAPVLAEHQNSSTITRNRSLTRQPEQARPADGDNNSSSSPRARKRNQMASTSSELQVVQKKTVDREDSGTTDPVSVSTSEISSEPPISS